MDPLLLCGMPHLSLYCTPTVSPCGEPQPIGADTPSLLCGAPSIMLCSELQPVSGDMPILLRNAQAPCTKGLLNPGDDAHYSVVHRVAGERLGSTGCGACSFSSSTRLMAEAALWWVGMLGKRWMCYRLRLSPPCVARPLCTI